jgi:predicted metal-dependent HD superfamily phosphohydrolase
MIEALRQLYSKLDLPVYFESLYKFCKLTPKTGESPWFLLKAAYETPPRAYHNLDHALMCAMMAEQHQLPAIGVMAMLYHDVYCVPGGGSNEEESVAVLRSHFSDWRDAFTKDVPLPHPEGPGPLNKISALILATKHKLTPSSPLEAWVMDIDMSILGSDPIAFAAYDKAIRAEYNALSDEVFDPGRVAFLIKLLRRKRIFFTTFMHDRYEAQARANLNARIHMFNCKGRESL